MTVVRKFWDGLNMGNWIVIGLIVIGLYYCTQPTYHDPFGNEITKEEHDRRVANDAAHDALINLMAECKANPHEGCPVQKE